MSAILTATVSIAVIGLLIGYLLVLFGKRFEVEIDPKEAAVREVLPGNNCGGCGFAGCDALAKSIAAGEAPIGACPVGGDPVATKIAHIMDVEEPDSSARKVAFVKCSGDCNKAHKSANYIGITDCQAAVNSGLGDKACSEGCLGYGSCVKACPFDAIRIVNGIAFVDRNACKACGKCVEACPKHLIELIPDKSQYAVRCNSNEKGPSVKKACSAGCIGCNLCVKQCENDAIAVTNFLSKIDYEKCVSCGKCAEKCPAKVIMKRF